MSAPKSRITKQALLGSVIAAALFGPAAWSAPLTLSTTPLFITPSVKPNILVIMDNSQSMDAYMSGTLVSGNVATTRGNVGRGVMSSVITSYRTTFNWGLMSFKTSTASPSPFNTYAYFMGSNTGMVFTNDCVGASTTANADGVYTSGISASNGNRKCVYISDPAQRLTGAFAGYNYVTYDRSGDDADILDVYYTSNVYSTLWGLHTGATASTTYPIYTSHTTSVNTWTPPPGGDFPVGLGNFPFTPTDAGFLSSNPPYTRQYYMPRALTGSGQCGYYSGITGYGRLDEAVATDSTTHYNALMAKLASETCTGSTGEIKNAAEFTPLRGTLDSSRQYFKGTSPYTSPITSSCQKNFVVMVTDGLPTGDTSGNLYSAAARTNTYNAGPPATWTFGTAAQDAINASCALRLPYTSSSLCTRLAPNGIPAADPIPPSDIETYVLALGDTVQNAGAVAVMNAMAKAGGTNSAYFATSASAFQTAFDSIASSILGKIGAASAVATNSTTLSTGNYIYQAKFDTTDWSGQLRSFGINATTGAISTTPAWEAGAISWKTGVTTSTQTYTQRNIFTFKPSTATGIPFLWPATQATPSTSELDISQSDALDKNSSSSYDGFGASRLTYLRGDTANEGTGLNFRVRSANKLGDIVDSTPAFVGKPDAGYPAALEAANYASFRNTNASRTKMLYVGGNDGMLHGIDTSSGQEILAYVPSKVYSNLTQLTASSYSHKYFVNGSPTISDVFYGGAWHTVLVGSLGQGGQGIFALDITDPTKFTESVTNASGLVLWEFNDADNAATTTSTDGDTDLGFTFSQPAVGRLCTTRTAGTCTASKWVAIFGNGYNNTEADGNVSTTGVAYLYIVDIANGNLLAKLDTTVGLTATPNGLASPTIVDVDGDYYVDYAYAGDLQGNMWKFDFTGNSISAWKVAYGPSNGPNPVYQAKSSDGTVQPITTRPQITTHPTGSGYLVLFGTGKYLEPSTDTTTTGAKTQTFYGIWDNGTQVNSVTTRNSTNLLQQAVDAETSAWRHTTNNVINWATHKGWYMDLCLNTTASGSCANNYGEKQVSHSVLANGRIIFTTLSPDATACFGGSSWLMELNFASGGQTPTSPFDTDSDGDFTSEAVAFGGTVGTAQANGTRVATTGIAGTPTLVYNPTNKTTYKYSNLSTGDLAKTDNNLGKGIGRVSWREMLNE